MKKAKGKNTLTQVKAKSISCVQQPSPSGRGVGVRAVSLYLLVIGICLVVAQGCGQTTSVPSATVYATATLKHLGFDFNSGVATTETDKSDGGTANWNPDTGQWSTVEGTTYPRDNIYIWWAPAWSPTYTLTQHHVGAVPLSSVTSIPTTWESTGSGIWPLLPGHSYVVKCAPSGYAKFYVTETRTLDAAGKPGSWEADVQYYFTIGSSFDK